MRRGSKPKWVKELALSRIEALLALAEKNLKKHPERTRRYVELSRKLSSKYNVTIPHELKRQLCRNCDAFLVPGYNLAVRTEPKNKAIVYTCLECGAKRRYGY
jgi:ribonuclease P protein subunit RPR2